MRNRTVIILCSALTLTAAFADRAAAEAGLTAAPALNAPIGARSAALGQAFTAVPGDAESLNYNPGALAFAPGFGVSASYMSGFDDAAHSFIAAPLKFGKLVVTPAYMYFTAGNMNLNLSDGTTGKVVAESDRAAYLSGAYRLAGRFGVGATLKHTRIELAETASASAMNYDLGALYSVENGLSLGASLMNSGDGFKFEEKSDPAPAVRRIGAAYKLQLNPPNLLDRSTDLDFCNVLFAADWISVYKDKSYAQTGLELEMGIPPGVVLVLRAGYLFNRPAEGMTFGIGFHGERLAFDYSLGTSKELNSRHQAGLGYKFY